MSLDKRKEIALNTLTLEIGGNRLDDTCIFRQLNELFIDLPYPLVSHWGQETLALVRCLLDFLGIGVASQPSNRIVLIRLANDTPETFLDNGTEESTRICLGDSESMSDGGKELTPVGLGIFETSLLDGFLPQLFASGVMV